VKKISIVGVLGVGRAHLLSIFMIAANHKQETYLIDLYDEKENELVELLSSGSITNSWGNINETVKKPDNVEIRLHGRFCLRYDNFTDDLMIVAVPIDVHNDICGQLLELTDERLPKKLLIEKPLATDSMILDTLASSGCEVFVGYEWLYHPFWFRGIDNNFSSEGKKITEMRFIHRWPPEQALTAENYEIRDLGSHLVAILTTFVDFYGIEGRKKEIGSEFVFYTYEDGSEKILLSMGYSDDADGCGIEVITEDGKSILVEWIPAEQKDLFYRQNEDILYEKFPRAMRDQGAQYVDFILEQMEHRVKE